ncbi:BLUF domain-containing protein [Aurantiacibacter poecillastricola]|uniref:BLUF domain-containing protein n=1 Tax=Aurantiacibacter poecillastricola TaxID=3064385 RepID=UPI00273ECCA2|nr:BLUF domain-containing protein [Aurantiacibacter sp. 219JJ12-13]MDP5260230.1 BLUF domain-containing protein [Aurantiacibacter sp. 219JJ12-13]
MNFQFDEGGLSRLLYTSHCAEEFTDRTRLDPGYIAEKAARNNALRDITGSLLFVEDQFIQILEGPAAKVEETFELICRDFRHHTLKLIDLVSVKERVFPEWSMACLVPDTETRIRLRDELDEIRFLLNVNASQAVQQMRALLHCELTRA